MSENPPAFPHGSKPIECPNCHWELQTYQPGMTLRDWFAGQALAGMADVKHLRESEDYEYAARFAYRFADAMLAERKRHEP